MTKADIWVIIPGFNEAKTIASVIKSVKKYSPNILFVDDGSIDGSSEIARKLKVKVLQHKINLGKGAALKTGCEFAFNQLDAQAVVFFDADGQHDAKQLKKFFKLIKTYPAVIGVRNTALTDKIIKVPLLRRISHYILNCLVYLLFGRYIPDIPSGFKALNKATYQQCKWQSSDYSVELELSCKLAKYKINFIAVPIPYIYFDREQGMNFIDGLKVLLKILYFRLTI